MVHFPISGKDLSMRRSLTANGITKIIQLVSTFAIYLRDLGSYIRRPIMLDSLIGSFGYLEMLDYLIEDNNLKDVLRQEGISDKDILFIKEMIAGPMSSKTGNQCCKLLSTIHSSLDSESISLIWIVYNI